MSFKDNKTSSSSNKPPVSQPDSRQASVAHELANLLDGSLRNVALVMARLREAQGHATSQEEAPELLARLDAANEAMRQMAALVAQLLDVGRRDASPQETMATGQSLGQTVRQAVHLLSPLATRQNVAIRHHLDQRAADLPAGPLFPVIINLLRNSLQTFDTLPETPETPETPEAPEACVELHGMTVGDDLLLVVEDNGPGFPPVLFDGQGAFRFGVTTRPGGHGLGLMLVRDVTEACAGRLSIASSAGARVTLRLPIHRLVEAAS